MLFREVTALALVGALIGLGGCDDPPQAGSLEGETYEEGIRNALEDDAAEEGDAVRPDSVSEIVGEGDLRPAGTFELEDGGAVDAGPADIEEQP